MYWQLNANTPLSITPLLNLPEFWCYLLPTPSSQPFLRSSVMLALANLFRLQESLGPFGPGVSQECPRRECARKQGVRGSVPRRSVSETLSSPGSAECPKSVPRASCGTLRVARLAANRCGERVPPTWKPSSPLSSVFDCSCGDAARPRCDIPLRTTLLPSCMTMLQK